MGKSSPKAPDYAAAAKAEGQASIDSAIAQAYLNNPNIVTPFGSYTNRQTGTNKIQTGMTKSGAGGNLFERAIYGTGPSQPIYTEIPTFTQEFNLNPGLQSSLDNLYSTISKPFDPSDPSVYESAFLKRLEPQLERAREAGINTMSVRGFRPGSTTYEVERELMNQQENDARAQAVTQGLQFDLAARNQPINEVTALMSGSQVGVPQFSGAGIATPNYLGAATAQGQHDADIFNVKQAQTGNLIGAGATIGAAYLGAAMI